MTPSGLRATKVTDTTFTVTWEKVLGNNVRYTVSYFDKATDFATTVQNIETTTKTITGLEAGKEYGVNVLATEIGDVESIISENIHVKLNKDATFVAAPGVNLSKKGTTYVEFCWSAVESALFDVKYREEIATQVYSSMT